MFHHLSRKLTIAAVVALVALGGTLGSAVSGTAQWGQPCTEKKCKKILWIDWCGDNEGLPTYCDEDTPQADCITRACFPV